MSKYIDADMLEKDGWNIHRTRQISSTEMVYETKKPTDFPTADVVSRGVLEQVMWERDLAVSQLAEIGKGVGEKMDDVAEVKRGRWLMKEYPDDDYTCSVCEKITRRYRTPYCGWCGSKMDGEEE